MKRKKSNFPDYWGVGNRSRKTPITPVIPVFKRDTKTDTDRDRVPNFRDCQPLNPHEHIFEKHGYALKIRDEKGKVTQSDISKREYLDIISLDVFGLPYSKPTFQQKHELMGMLRQREREGKQAIRQEAREKGRISAEKYIGEQQERKEKARDIKFERKKMIESGLSYAIVAGSKGGNNFIVMAAKQNEDKTSFVGKPKKVFQGTFNQCRIWGKKRGLRF